MCSIKKLVLLLVLTLSCCSLSAEKKFVVTTMPKTGTFLIVNLLENLTGKTNFNVGNPQNYPHISFERFTFTTDQELYDALRADPCLAPLHWFGTSISTKGLAHTLDVLDEKGMYLLGHVPFSQQFRDLLLSKNYVNFFIIRDLRDWTLSYLRHIKQRDGDWRCLRNDWFMTLSCDEQLFHVIQGTRWYNRARYYADMFLPWKDSPTTCVLRFEKLVGPSKGNCTREEHLAELRKIAVALEMECTDEELLSVFRKSFGRDFTYTPAKTGRWRGRYKEQHKEVFKSVMGDWLVELGYEKDQNW